MDLSYFQKINNTYGTQRRQDTDLFELNRLANETFADNIDYHIVERNGEDFELLIIKVTDANTHERKIKSRPGQPFNLGDYIKWNNQTWIVTTLDVDDKTHNSGIMYLCTYTLHWQDEEGRIISRPAYMQDFTKYATGQENNGALVVGDNQYGAIIPIDEDTVNLRRDTRMVVDELLDKPDVYMVTNRKVALNDYKAFGRGGTITVTLSVNSFNQDTDKYVDIGNGEMAWICDYKESDKPTPVKVDVLGIINGKDYLRAGYKRKYSVLFTDNNGNDITNSITEFSWNVVSDFNIKIINGLDIYSVYLQASEEDIGKTFSISVVIDNKAVTTKSIMVTAD